VSLLAIHKRRTAVTTPEGKLTPAQFEIMQL